MPTYIGIDWSTKKHDVMFMNALGGTIQSCVIEHSLAGFRHFDELRQQLGVAPSDCIIGLETAHTTLIDYLWATGYEQIYVLAPGTVQANRGRNRQTGARNDRYDAFVIADTLRTDRHRHCPWTPGSPTLQQMRVLVSRGDFFSREVTKLANRLHAVLERYYPAALAVFKSWPTPLNCHWVLAYPTPAAAATVTWPAFQAFAAHHHYPDRRHLLTCYDRLQAAYPPAAPALVAAYQSEAVQLAQLLLLAFAAANENLRHLQTLFRSHADAHIFASLPGTGPWLAPALLAKLGEDRSRFPTPAALQALAGTCPVTNQSGNKRVIYFRRSCDHSLRQIVQQWARCSVMQSAWAAAYYAETRARCGSDNQAYRCLANRWLAVLWKLWQTHADYDEAIHVQNRAARRQPRAAHPA